VNGPQIDATHQQKRRWLTVLVVAIALFTTSFAVTLATLPTQPLRIDWGRPAAVQIPPTRGSDDEVLLNAISCTTATACSAGGFISTSATSEAIVIDESNGVWHKAHVIRGAPTIGQSENATINAISCASPGNCSAGGYFENVAGLSRSEFLGDEGLTTAFVVNEIDGTWRGAHALAGVVAPRNVEDATINFLSCASAGNCAAAGRFGSVPCADGDNSCVLAGSPYKRQFQKSFVVNEVRGVWGSPQWLSGANRGEYPNLNGLSCGAPGSCTAVGTSGTQESFVATETNGRWAPSVLFPGSTLADQTGSTLSAVSCGSRRNCGAGGSYTDKSGDTIPFVIDEVAGTWRRAMTVKGSDRPAINGYAEIQSISCDASNDCTAFGEALGGRGKGLNYFVLSKRNGTWGSVRLVPGAASSDFDGFSGSEMACTTNQSCTIAGSYFTTLQQTTPYALSESFGHFTHVVNLRGVAKLHLAPSAGDVVAVSCGARDNCVIVEFFASFDDDNSFLVHESLR
jgi:hypothetical protein